jgi:hypothetical protein
MLNATTIVTQVSKGVPLLSEIYGAKFSEKKWGLLTSDITGLEELMNGS